MLLSLLSKEEKYYFLDLVSKLIRADGDPSEIDLQVLTRLKYEMGDEAQRYRRSSLTVDKLVDYFAAKSKVTKNLVFMNLVSVSLYDEIYSVEEHLLIEEVQEAFNITDKKKADLMKVVYAERDLRERAKRTITE